MHNLQPSIKKKYVSNITQKFSNEKKTFSNQKYIYMYNI